MSYFLLETELFIVLHFLDLTDIAFPISETGDPRKGVTRFSSNHFTVILSHVCWVLHRKLSRYFVGRLTVNLFDTLSRVSRSIMSIYCLASHGELSPYFVGRLTSNLSLLMHLNTCDDKRIRVSELIFKKRIDCDFVFRRSTKGIHNRKIIQVWSQ
jgi:hypothetical protein